MSTFQPPPTWANPVVVDEATGKSIFNPVWLKWFIDLSAGLESTGSGSGNASGYAPVTIGHFAKWLDTSATALGDGGVIGSASHANVADFLPAGVGFTGTVTTASLVGKTLTIEDGIITGFA